MEFFACSGILFNHESPLKGLEFVTCKITPEAARIKYELQNKIVLGNLDLKRDWGYASKYVETIWLMLQQDEPDDYVIATSEIHSVREFVELAFKYAGYEIIWEGKGLEEKRKRQKTGKILVEVFEEFYRPAEVNVLIGDYSEAKQKLGWKPKTYFKELVRIMVEADLKQIKENLKSLSD